jgi:hypothetical protein
MLKQAMHIAITALLNWYLKEYRVNFVSFNVLHDDRDGKQRGGTDRKIIVFIIIHGVS